MSEEKSVRFADTIWAFQEAQDNFEEALAEAGLEKPGYGSMGWDYYDLSLELYKVEDGVRLTSEQQRIIHDAGFSMVFINHKDGWETHYSWDWRDTDFKPSRGWRRRWVVDPTATSTRSVGLAPVPDNAGYYEISYWPEGWNQLSTKDWLSTGYMRIVPDPLEALK